MRALVVLPFHPTDEDLSVENAALLSIGMIVSSVATTCDARTLFTISLYSGSTRSAASPHQTDCVARDLETLSLEDVFQPVQRQVIGKLARHDVTTVAQVRPAPFDRRSGLPPLGSAARRCRPGRAGILLAQVLDAFEMAGKIFDLPGLVRADLFALRSAAGPMRSSAPSS